MTTHFSTLIEKALTSDSDPERIACLNQARKIYRNEGIAMPKRVRRTMTTEVATTDASARRDLEGQIKLMQADVDRARKAESTLSADNTRLSTENLKLGKRNAELETDNIQLAEKANKRLQSTIAAWVIAVVAVVVAVIMV